jgi:threonine synthase
MCGGRLVLVDGLISDCGRISSVLAAATGGFDLSTLKEPYRLEGKKTIGFELAEGLGWRLPDVIVFPTGGGTGMVGLWKAFQELEAMGLIDGRRPRMVAVQSEGCAPSSAPSSWAPGSRRPGRTRPRGPAGSVSPPQWGTF